MSPGAPTSKRPICCCKRFKPRPAFPVPASQRRPCRPRGRRLPRRKSQDEADRARSECRSACAARGRAAPLLQEQRLDEADKACSHALAAKASWGFWEDTPEKLRRDISRAHQVADRDESVRLMVEARKSYAAGNLDEAEKKAYQAQQLHGPYGVFDFGERPARLLEEVRVAKLAKAKDNPAEPAGSPRKIPTPGRTPRSAFPPACRTPTRIAPSSWSAKPVSWNARACSPRPGKRRWRPAL